MDSLFFNGLIDVERLMPLKSLGEDVSMIITVTLNPAIDKTVEIKDFKIGAVNRIASMRQDAGGKGINVSKVIQRMKGESKALGILAGPSGSFIKSFLDSTGINNEFLFIEGETRTNFKIIDTINKTHTDINEPGPEVSEEDIMRVKEILLNQVNAGSVVVFSGSVPVHTDTRVYGKWIKACREQGVKTILDADGELLKYGMEAGPYLVKPNRYELERFFGKEIETTEEIEALGRSLILDYGIEQVVVSLGEKGALFIDRHQSLMAKALKVDVKSTVGAGDSMVASLALSICRKDSLEAAARLAMAASIANVMTEGSQPADYETILELEKKIRYEIMRDYFIS